MTESGKTDDGVRLVYTLLSPVRFEYQTEDGIRYKEGVVKLNVKEYINPKYPNQVHENKVLGVENIGIQEKESGTFKAIPPPMIAASFRRRLSRHYPLYQYYTNTIQRICA